MREILFRGKNKHGKWYYGFYTEGYYLDGTPVSWIEVVDRKKKDIDCPTVIPETVGQYTGLKDMDGKRIFEGDICRNTRTGEIVSVKWHGTMAGYVWSKRKANSHFYDFGELFRAYDKYKVIGNVHDNPELLWSAKDG